MRRRRVNGQQSFQVAAFPWEGQRLGLAGRDTIKQLATAVMYNLAFLWMARPSLSSLRRVALIHHRSRFMLPLSRRSHEMEGGLGLLVVVLMVGTREVGRVVGVTHYDVTVAPAGRYWHIEVPAVERVTQARHLREVEEMARDLISIMTGEEPEKIELGVRVVLPESVRAHLDAAGRLRQESARSQAEAARQLISF